MAPTEFTDKTVQEYVMTTPGFCYLHIIGLPHGVFNPVHNEAVRYDLYDDNYTLVTIYHSYHEVSEAIKHRAQLASGGTNHIILLGGIGELFRGGYVYKYVTHNLDDDT